MILRRVNLVLTLAIAAEGLYLVFSPLYPGIALWARQTLGGQDGFRYASHLSAAQGAELPPPPDGNRLVIPQIFVDGEIHEGASVATLDQGIWHRPVSNTPDQGGNVVLAAHRYLYASGPNTFYNLDKMAAGDEFFLIWDDVEYDYRVRDIREVSATATEIEAPTGTDMLTLFTCTPLWTAKNRLVVRADLIESYPVDSDSSSASKSDKQEETQ
jgi:LPXTG-site transpeptidase (sortase) family protein